MYRFYAYRIIAVSTIPFIRRFVSTTVEDELASRVELAEDMVYSGYKKQRVLHLHREGFKSPTIAKMLRNEGLKVSKYGVLKFLKRFKETGSIARKLGSGRPCKITPTTKALIDNQMEKDDETTAVQIHKLLLEMVSS